MTEYAELKAGHLVSVTEGCYSDYSVTGNFVVLQTFKPMELLADWLAVDPERRAKYGFSGNAFLASLLAKGLLLEIHTANLHLGDYSCAGEVYFTPLPEA